MTQNYDAAGNSNVSFHVLSDTLNLLFTYDFLYFSMYSIC